jgi:hypothetical protein|tara:strand:- start:1251 stop:1532 length:282 start_codon:yes stop_codon:yes gene_type:complete
MDNVQIATDAIRNIKTNDELDQLVEVFKLQRTYFSRNVARTLMIGDTVSFDANTRGVIKGKVTKVNQKTVKVRCDRTQTTWKVTASCLKLETA